MEHESAQPPSDWVVSWSRLIPKPGRILDVACGSGRHTWLFAELGFDVDAVDRDIGAVSVLASRNNINVRATDLENSPWPYPQRAFDGVVVTNYLYRPLFPFLLASLKADGILIYETFAEGNERFGKPSNPNFLLRSGELLEAVRGEARVIAYEDVYVEIPKPAMVQRICARRIT